MSIEADEVGRGGDVLVIVVTDISFLTSFGADVLGFCTFFFRSYFDTSKSGAGLEKR